MYDVAIIGCGVIGAAAAYALSRYDNKVVILEAENDVADCTTKANSAILHAGYDPAPGTRMAQLNVRGVALAKEICAKLDISYKQCGSLVLALDEKELPHLQHLFENGTANGVPDMKILSREETLAMEPNLSEKVCGALWAPSAAIVNPWEYALAMTEVAVRNGVELRRSCKVTNAEAIEGGYRLTVPGGTVETRCVINAAGIWADKVHSMVEPANFHIIPTRGEYYLLDKSEGTRVSHVIFQCPNELGKGVLVAPTVHGNLIVGPNADPVEGDDTACTADAASGTAGAAHPASRAAPAKRIANLRIPTPPILPYTIHSRCGVFPACSSRRSSGGGYIFECRQKSASAPRRFRSGGTRPGAGPRCSRCAAPARPPPAPSTGLTASCGSHRPAACAAHRSAAYRVRPP